MSSTLYRFSLTVTALAMIVMLVGAYVRLSDAGLGCPDWPGCYGQLIVPDTGSEMSDAQGLYPDRILDREKAGKEMLHRYLAGTLGLAVLLLAVFAWRNRHRVQQNLLLPFLLLGLVIFQSLLGMWTVTLLVKPLVVTAHLLGGLATVSLLWLMTLGYKEKQLFGNLGHRSSSDLTLAWIGLSILLLQVSLGGWTSSNYAALGCTGFPGCFDVDWWPQMDFVEGFVLWRGLGVDYEYGVLELAARSAIHMSHRIGALVTVAYLGFFAYRCFRSSAGKLPLLAGILTMLLVLQIVLGISNVLMGLPMVVAIAHNGAATLLVLVLVTMIRELD